VTQQKVAAYKKIHSFAFDIAEETGCGVSSIFEQMDRYAPEIIKRMIAFTKKHHRVISDLHFAIQPRVDSMFFLEGRVDDDLISQEAFRSAFVPNDFARITNEGILLIIILIVCDIDELFCRMERRKEQNLPIRSMDRQIIEKECVAEFNIYCALMRELGLQTNIILNPNGRSEDCYKEMLSLLQITP